ncbi:GNAT family N-acetyltransferase [Dyadobacter sp. CY343]|uniref:GNAT family N-acetyltransferase n=1 Tax=Dyadobacter sp. CY343 TaxID=2907299 RepID=UPI001F41603A|nr:GNAT family N-acetyltransferase [Dyadobacter sp. CY343]MCE7063470.1 GNAT family N-acetyltransferase [Dyadobacter sp. CY343]
MTELIRTNSENPDFKTLTDKLDDELCRIYNTKKEDFEEYNRITGLKTVLLAYSHGRLAACGCFKILSTNTIELKRMYVEPDFRGRGIASALVAEIEKWALELGYNTAFLETGKGQPQAIALYKKLGYKPVTDPILEVSDYSVCMQKDLKP